MQIAMVLSTIHSSLMNSATAVSIPIRTVRAGKELRLVIPPDPAVAENGWINPALVKLVAHAMAFREILEQGHFTTMTEFAAACGYGRETAADLRRISYLAPDIIGAILDGRQPADLTRTKLFRWPALPLRWIDQRTALGFS